MYDHITPNQWVLGLVVSLGAFAVLWWQLWRRFPPDDGRVMSSPKVEAPVKPNASVQDSVRLPDALPPTVERGVQRSNPDVFVPPNEFELTCLAQTIRHKYTTRGATKSEAIKAGFGLSRGGDWKYARASELYDLMMAPPQIGPHYRPLTPDKQPA